MGLDPFTGKLLKIVTIPSALKVHRTRTFYRILSAMHSQPFLNAAPGASGKTPVAVHPLYVKRGSVVKSRDDNWLPIPPPVYAGIGEKHALLRFRGETEQLVEFQNVRLVCDFAQ